MAASGSPKSEIRFAVVMYGGVSLAIYMNGIAQELLRMVRATATMADGHTPQLSCDKLDRVEAVYRKIAYRLAGEEDLQDCLESNASLERKFSIDVISGTSAGGINGIFLAKALANGLGMDELKKLWILEGDAGLLINDRKSLRDTVLKPEKGPQSLFNSRRMYQKLLEAFEKMEQSGDAASGGAYAGELDLFVTATDILGLTLPIELSDSTIYERRHRNVFRFSCSDTAGTPWNDFVKENNPMLAFAARSTSSFPFAFEPVMFSDIDEVLKRKGYADDFLSTGKRWKRFFKNYPEKPPSGMVGYEKRPFGDGGYLDNKPFSYAIETISARHSDFPVQRKLLYIEPVPEHPEADAEKDGRPNALENSFAALLKLPRYETIRSDLERILERNRLIERMERIISHLDADKRKSGWAPPYEKEYKAWEKKNREGSAGSAPLWAKPLLNDHDWGQLDLGDMTRRKGPGYVAYQRLEIEAVTDDFGRLLARVAGFDENADTMLVFRSLVQAWRESRFVRYRGGDDDGAHADESFPDATGDTASPTMNEFLHRFDLTFPLRRLRFVRRRIDRLYLMNGRDLACELKNWLEDPMPADSAEWMPSFREELLAVRKVIMQMQSKLIDAGRELRSRFRAVGADLQMVPQGPSLQDLAGQLVAALSSSDDVRKAECSESKDTAACAVRSADEREKAFRPVIDFFLGALHRGGGSREEERETQAKAFLADNPAVPLLLDSIAKVVEERLKTAIEESDRECRLALGIDVGKERKASAVGALAARTVLTTTYRTYSDYDMVLFPVLYGTGADDGIRIEVSRISPEDATLLVNEREDRHRKLAGTALGNFGAFMEERWRRNDIMWGQLDGTERIIRALLADHNEAERFTGEAQAAIVLDTIRAMGVEESKDLLVEAFMRPLCGKPDPEPLTRFIHRLNSYAGEYAKDEPDAFNQLDARELRDHYREKFRENHTLQPESALKNAARATTVTGKILSTIADQYGIAGKSFLAVVMRAGTVFWWLLEAAVPRSMASLVFRHWRQLLYLFEVLLVVLGYLFVNPGVQRIGLTALALTGAVHITVLWLRDILFLKNGWPFFLKSLGTGLVLLLLLSGIAFFGAVTGIQQEWWGGFTRLHDWFVSMNLWD